MPAQTTAEEARRTVDATRYFRAFEALRPPFFAPLSRRRARAWHLLAGMTVAFGTLYLHWRWTQSLNQEAILFSVVVALAETLFFIGTLLFFYDIWDEGDTAPAAPPRARAQAGLGPRDPDGVVDPAGDAPTSGSDGISVDLFVTTFDEEVAVVGPSLAAAAALGVPPGVSLSIWLLDDGNREEMRVLAQTYGANYIARATNEGYKAGNLRNALFQTDGDFVVICDADTRVFPTFLVHTLGYFRDPDVAWVQTPHWFYDIPQGRALSQYPGWIGQTARRLGIGGTVVGRDPFLAEPALFFDVIQRRRNRHGASFCCGAGSIHRREAVFDGALAEYASEVARSATISGGSAVGHGWMTRAADVIRRIVPGAASPGLPRRLAAVATPVQPFRFHVSEDIYTSIVLHGQSARRWRSVYHPQPESRMLSPWSMDAFATQKLKYAGGTLDIFWNGVPLRRPGMPIATRLHYAATFWSYLGVLWAPVLLIAPVISLSTGLSPVDAYSATFFVHLLPVLLVSELAMVVACKGHAVQPGRTLALACLPITLRALWCVLRQQRPRFPTTPKKPGQTRSLRHVRVHLALLAVMAVAAVTGITGGLLGWAGFDASLVVVNLFWLAWNATAIARAVQAAWWSPEEALSRLQATVPAPTAEPAP